MDRAGQRLVSFLPELEDPLGTNSASLDDLMALQIEDFVRAARGGLGPQVDPEMATRTIALVERCEAALKLAKYPWEQRPVFTERPALPLFD